ncbi:hypothetical protein [Cognaticolwellia beringensis]|uniref:DUF481 domain-containing protein n=1 Tax=Cognaticolwellia beringensis TaxID=1967665 RepID=A0A222G7C1_9GAMM|nr:hypothetical protein [Cognaticolwellia beringensis]ASP47788.1 hypothetical protein B5D82_08495 [Cognaticolwellia beringensis]
MLFYFAFANSAQAYTSQEVKEPVEQKDDHWMQGLHETVSDSVYQSAQWFDSFFIANESEQQSPKTTAKISFAWLPKSRDWSEVKPRFRVRVKLPHFQDRVSVVLSDEADDELNNLPLESVNTKSRIEEEKFSLALNYTQDKRDDRLMNYRLGISGGDIFVRAKHKRRFNISTKQGFLFEPSLYYYLDEGLGAKLLLEYDYQLSKKSQFRINYSIRGSAEFSGIRWKHGFYKLHQINETTASVLSLQVEGERNGDRGFVIDKYTLGYRYRFNALRDWLFFEIEPFVEFPEEENYSTTPGIALRIEGFFHKG